MDTRRLLHRWGRFSCALAIALSTLYLPTAGAQTEKPKYGGALSIATCSRCSANR